MLCSAALRPEGQALRFDGADVRVRQAHGAQRPADDDLPAATEVEDAPHVRDDVLRRPMLKQHTAVGAAQLKRACN